MSYQQDSAVGCFLDAPYTLLQFYSELSCAAADWSNEIRVS